ncbi:hypothetical protein Y1Q_0004861 [Alligator mississippiensis]|uniref:Uncharacterized protein n=1 Tax=Alligator mississippiensis TaxID=8496 RepID=A0A151NQV8_ALLMI|nr:hypothetical protein Y1Q_0004861 [Alligator mississippiensis]
MQKPAAWANDPTRALQPERNVASWSNQLPGLQPKEMPETAYSRACLWIIWWLTLRDTSLDSGLIRKDLCDTWHLNLCIFTVQHRQQFCTTSTWTCVIYSSL